MRIPFGLAFRHIRVHWFRDLLTVGAVTMATFLFCFLVSVLDSLEGQIEDSSQSRVIVQSSVSLFVDLPLEYQAKISGVPGIRDVTKWQWFGAYFQEPKNAFAQFGVDVGTFDRMYQRDIAIIAGPEPMEELPRRLRSAPGSDPDPERRASVLRAMLSEKRGALIGRTLAEKYGWRTGDTIPLTCTIFPKADGSAWEFTVVGIFEKLKQNIDEQTMFFRFDYLEDTMRYGGAAGEIGSGTYFVQLEPGVDPSTTIESIDALFANGPQRTKTYTEAAFQQGFVSMMGNVPLFLGSIGGAVVAAVFFSVVNAMLISGRQRMRESGILQALGFRSRAIGALVGFEALLLCGLGGTFGILLAAGASDAIRSAFSGFANLAVARETQALGLALALGIGAVAAIPPWVLLVRTKPADALRDAN